MTTVDKEFDATATSRVKCLGAKSWQGYNPYSPLESRLPLYHKSMAQCIDKGQSFCVNSVYKCLAGRASANC